MLLTRWLPAWKMRLPFCDRVDHRQPVGDVVRHRLLAVDVLARLEAIEHHAAVLKIGNGHDHGIDVLAIQQRTIIARVSGMSAP